MQPFRNPAEAKKQGRQIVGSYPYYGSEAQVYSALPHEYMAKHVGKRISLKYHGQLDQMVGTVAAAGYDDTGGCFPCVVVDDGNKLTHCLSCLSLKEWKIL